MIGAVGVDDDPLAGILPSAPDRQRTCVRLPGFIPVPEDARLLDLEQIGKSASTLSETTHSTGSRE
ncbi:hypothetical protein J2X01_004417 [Arthrobacter ginsengisoli]|uniref:Uncharacterized protein n=1 Tax=Arthrobacter ginsengisoli TaxID=1356565 RepID=A0ABU1UIS3_9MICC|nr:hypothetical protein [Arthrobacter ginsengisoli]